MSRNSFTKSQKIVLLFSFCIPYQAGLTSLDKIHHIDLSTLPDGEGTHDILNWPHMHAYILLLPRCDMQHSSWWLSRQVTSAKRGCWRKEDEKKTGALLEEKRAHIFRVPKSSCPCTGVLLTRWCLCARVVAYK